MNKRKRGASALMLAALLAVLAGCSVDENAGVVPEANYSVDITVPFVTVTQAPVEERDDPDIAIDANGNVKVYETAKLIPNENTQVQTDDSGYTTLKLGSSGDDVKRMQQRLKDLQYFDGTVTGIFDNNTEKAVRRFERTYGVMQTGLATATFQTRLYADDAPVYGSETYEEKVSANYNTLQRGSVGSAVYALQYRLRELGYPIAELTAIYDDQTEYAVRLFAHQCGVNEMSVAYISLQKEMYAEDAPRYSGSDAVASANAEAEELTMGASGTLVMQLQNRLIELGYLDGTASGVYDAETVTAVQLFQKVCGFEVTGSLPYYLQAVLLSDDSVEYSVGNVSMGLSLNDQGVLVKTLQERLIELGYASGTASGKYDTATSEALKLFQRFNGFPMDGIATEEVQRTLYDRAAVSYKQGLRMLAGDVGGETIAPAETATPQPTEEPMVLPIPTETPAPTTAETSTPAPSGVDLTDNGEPLPTLANDSVEVSNDIAVPLETAIPGVEEVPAETPVPAPTMAASDVLFAKGSSGTAVKAIQSRLSDLGYTCDRNGKYDDATEAAIRELQYRIGVTQSGTVSSTLYAYMFSNSAPSTDKVMYKSTQDYRTLTKGDIGESVTRLQKQLGRLGFMLTADIEASAGMYDDATEAAVLSAQNAMGYETPDGVAGPEFQCFVFSEFSRYIKR